MPNADTTPRTLDAEAVRERIRRKLVGTTHWSGCEADHDLCAADMALARLTERNRALEALVESAFEEGYDEGWRERGDGGGYDSKGFELLWTTSKSRRALTDTEAPHD